jgi:hypothetical protein
MPTSRLVSALAIAIAAVSLAGCSKTNLTNLWKSPDAPAAPLQNVLVIFLERDAELNRTWEDAITAEFQAAGVHARPAYAIFPAQLPDSQQITVVAQRDDYDGIVVVRRVPVTQKGFDSGYADRAPGGSNDYWRSWYHTHYLAASTTPPPKKGEDARFQIDVAGTAGKGNLLWTGSTTPLDPYEIEKVRTEVCGQLLDELQRQRVIAGRD